MQSVIAAVVFISLCVGAVVTRILFQNRQAEQLAAVKEKEHRRGLEQAYRTELDLQNSIRGSRKEYFI
ncbi:hypothetical protein Z043_108327 [Scleropages formosus]|uniref:Uncharacterized protein n=1 Tax=Scleropages formosus TaxID=113540 RepID=A0A0P7YWP3_SCLFO|nr:hypothetical protein Z043_108327 [Scleropages formosus]